jgi:choline dehydrogenase-like flavoprotein
MSFDYIIVGAGSAGCVLAERLSANPANRVLLLEAGGKDDGLLVHMPRGLGKLLWDPVRNWHFHTEAYDDVPAEVWIRGRMLGGSSSVNGMMYFRGQPADYDGWEALGAEGWGWDQIGPAFRAIENHELGDDGVRGAAGPLRITVSRERTPLTEAFIAAGQGLGVPRVEDLNNAPGGGVGYAPRTVWKGRRQSAAKAFLREARRRPNLRVVTGALVDRVLFEGRRAVGVAAQVDGVRQEFRAEGEVILSAGALVTPQILQRSGVGAGAHLQPLGIPVVVESPGVGEHMLEHRMLTVQYELKRPLSQNPQLRGVRLAGNLARYVLTRSGPMAAAYGPAAAFARVLPQSATPDVEILFSHLATVLDAKGALVPDRAHSIQLSGYPLRSRSEGSVRIVSKDPAQPGRIQAGYLSDPYDREVTVAMHRFIRRWMRQPALADIVGEEREPTRSLETDEEILAGFRRLGTAGMHACGTCRMGAFEDAVLDARLRVRGVDALRVVDGSIMPAMVSANTNGPISAAAWRGAALILEGRNR